MPQGLIDPLHQPDELGEALQVGRPLADFLPEIPDRIEIWRVRRQLKDGQPFGVGGEELAHLLAGAILGPVMDQDEMLLGLGQHILQGRRIGRRVDAIRPALVEELPRPIRDQAEHPVRLALAS
jgi:hypothetical protein